MSNREIKFRIWDKTTNRYEYDWQAVIAGHNEAKYNREIDCTAIEDKALIWEQFTGLYDKNRKGIYENDILKFITFGFDSETFVTAIQWRKAGWVLKNGRNLFYFGQKDLTKLDDCKYL